jgi:membrane protease YdiL (CAAX protease family)
MAGGGCSLLLWVLRGLGALARLEHWQSEMVKGWTVTDALAVALFSGLAEEALLRALVQPLIGLLPAAAIFAVLHLIPDRKLWLWPVLALAMGVVLGGVFELAGYPAAAIAHIVINGLSLLRLRLPQEG